MTALDMHGVVVGAGRTRILDDVSLSVEPGRIVVVVGANGAGKTTLLDAACGEVPAAAGAVRVAGRPPDRRSIGRVFQGSPLPATLTVAEVAALAAREDGAPELMDRFGLRRHATTFVAELSTGMRRILDLAVATASRPALLLLDEPSSGLAQAEVERLASLILRCRDETGAAVVCVEHDAWLVRRIADEVVVMDGGRIVATGSARAVLGRHTPAVARLRHPRDARFAEVLRRVGEDAAPVHDMVRRSVSTWTWLRLGLREFAAGMGSVLILGVLNRVMKKELGISLTVVAAVLASYNLAAPFALAIGHRSDRHPIRRYRRLPYILGGTLVTGVAVACAPLVATLLQHGVTVPAVAGSVALFVAMGVGMYGSGTVFFALIADIAPEAERGRAASIVYLELMGGILFGVALTGAILGRGAEHLQTLFVLAGIIVIALTTLAVWGMDRPVEQPAGQTERPPSFLRTIRTVAAMSQTRLFFSFMVLATFFLFLQQAVLEPFGGDVLGLDPRQTSAFNAVQTLGVLVGMIVAGRNPASHRRIAGVGLASAAASFGVLAIAAATSSSAPTWLAILAVGTATGVFNVAVLALMMTMADGPRVALFMGAWTVAHALADGSATAGGGLVYDVAHSLLGLSTSGGYAAVFAAEALGLAACMPLLRRIDPDRFRAQLSRCS
jgi:BCD family chlorophyll transporter-like MFS transporter